MRSNSDQMKRPDGGYSISAIPLWFMGRDKQTSGTVLCSIGSTPIGDASERICTNSNNGDTYDSRPAKSLPPGLSIIHFLMIVTN